MRVKLLSVSGVLALIVLVSTPVRAHHSFAAEYLFRMEEWTGTVTKLLFRTPHAHFFMDVKDKSGKVTNWTFELTTPEQLLRRGITRSSIKIGQQLTIVGYPAKDNQPMAMTRTISSPEGQLLFVWDYEDFGQTKSDGIVVTPTGERQQFP